MVIPKETNHKYHPKTISFLPWNTQTPARPRLWFMEETGCHVGFSSATSRASTVLSLDWPSYPPITYTLVFTDTDATYLLRLLILYSYNFIYVRLDKPKLLTYVKFKTCFKIEDYVMSFMSRRQRSYLGGEIIVKISEWEP